MEQNEKNRRAFVKTCVTAATAVAANPVLLASAAPVRQYQRTLLVNPEGIPVTSQDIAADTPFVFHYPYVTTPCFLINLGRSLEEGQQLQTATEGTYTWQGGSGPEKQVVAFSAICAHKLSYPTRTLSFLNYRADTVRFVNRSDGVEEKTQLIYCCSERSAYDPAAGAKVLGGPASQPLAAVELEFDEANDQYYATGTRGGELYDSFFEKFGFRLALDHELTDVREQISDKTTVWPHQDYSSNPVAC